MVSSNYCVLVFREVFKVVPSKSPYIENSQYNPSKKCRPPSIQHSWMKNPWVCLGKGEFLLLSLSLSLLQGMFFFYGSISYLFYWAFWVGPNPTKELFLPIDTVAFRFQQRLFLLTSKTQRLRCKNHQLKKSNQNFGGVSLSLPESMGKTCQTPLVMWGQHFIDVLPAPGNGGRLR